MKVIPGDRTLDWSRAAYFIKADNYRINVVAAVAVLIGDHVSPWTRRTSTWRPPCAFYANEPLRKFRARLVFPRPPAPLSSCSFNDQHTIALDAVMPIIMRTQEEKKRKGMGVWVCVCGPGKSRDRPP